MSAKRFIDTNIPLYAIGSRRADRAKSEIAREILKSEDICTSAQVLQEFFVQAIHPAREDRIPHEEAIRFVEALCEFPVQEVTADLVLSAMRTKERLRIAYWDAAVIEAARALECEIVLSEDLRHGQDYGGVRVVDPFRRSRGI